MELVKGNTLYSVYEGWLKRSKYSQKFTIGCPAYELNHSLVSSPCSSERKRDIIAKKVIIIEEKTIIDVRITRLPFLDK